MRKTLPERHAAALQPFLSSTSLPTAQKFTSHFSVCALVWACVCWLHLCHCGIALREEREKKKMLANSDTDAVYLQEWHRGWLTAVSWKHLDTDMWRLIFRTKTRTKEASGCILVPYACLSLTGDVKCKRLCWVWVAPGWWMCWWGGLGKASGSCAIFWEGRKGVSVCDAELPSSELSSVRKRRKRRVFNFHLLKVQIASYMVGLTGSLKVILLVLLMLRVQSTKEVLIHLHALCCSAILIYQPSIQPVLHCGE